MNVDHALATTRLPDLSPQAECIRLLATKTPQNNFSLPEGYYRADLLPATIPQNPGPYDEDIGVAYEPLSYLEGYPSVGGLPFWHKLPHEGVHAHACFEVYLAHGKMGARQLYKVVDDERVKALPEKITLDMLQEWYHLYYWAARVRSHDLFYAAHRQRLRAMQAFEAEDDQRIIAERIIHLCCTYLDQNEEELIESMTPKAFTEMLKNAVAMQRVSLGLPLNGGAKENDSVPNNLSVDLIMKTIAQKSGAIAEGHNAKLNDEEERNARLKALMENPETLALAQMLQIRITQQPAEKEPTLPVK